MPRRSAVRMAWVAGICDIFGRLHKSRSNCGRTALSDSGLATHSRGCLHPTHGRKRYWASTPPRNAARSPFRVPPDAKRTNAPRADQYFRLLDQIDSRRAVLPGDLDTTNLGLAPLSSFQYRRLDYGCLWRSESAYRRVERARCLTKCRDGVGDLETLLLQRSRGLTHTSKLLGIHS